MRRIYLLVYVQSHVTESCIAREHESPSCSGISIHVCVPRPRTYFIGNRMLRSWILEIVEIRVKLEVDRRSEVCGSTRYRERDWWTYASMWQVFVSLQNAQGVITSHDHRENVLLYRQSLITRRGLKWILVRRALTRDASVQQIIGLLELNTLFDVQPI